MKVVYFGTPSIAAHILDFLLQHQIDVVAVVTKADKRQGRAQHVHPSAVKEMLVQRYPHIPIIQPLKISTEEYQKLLASFEADVFVVVAYGEILKSFILQIPPLGCINVHASLLPKYRGAAPMHRAIINGEKETGVCIMEMVLALDAGAILQMVKTAIPEDMNVGELEQVLERIGQEALLETLKDLKNKRDRKVVQDESLVTYAAKITPEECEIHWDLPTITIHNLIRGVTPFPGAWCKIKINRNSGAEEKRLKIKRTRIVELTKQEVPGTVIKYEQDQWLVATQDGCLQLLEVQLEGKKAASAAEFIRGYPCPQF